MEIRINTLTPELFLDLYKSVGWEPPCIEQVRIALKNTISRITVPKGTIIYEGTAAPQIINGGTGQLIGGGNQVFIPREVIDPSWFGN